MAKKILSIFTFIFSLIATASLNAEIVKKIEIDGNVRISDETIRVYGDLKELNSDYSKSDLDNILKNLYFPLIISI